MQRSGRKNRPFYRIQVVDSRVRRDGLGVEQLGWYDPVNRDEAKQLKLNEERTKYWISKGAQPSDTLRDIFAKKNLIETTKWNAVRSRRRELISARTAAAAAAAAAPAEGEKKPEAKEEPKA
jgi:small subunit ribosomal protein S16